jgi:hypothetical protein
MIAGFRQGRKYVDLNSTNLKLGSDFIPPQVAEAYTIGNPSSSGSLSGGDLIDVQSVNRELTFSVNVFGANRSECGIRARALSSFLSTYHNETIFLEYSEFDAPSPKWGTLGAPKRYEIVSASANLFDDFAEFDQGYVVGISLVIKPLAVGKFMRAAQALGGILEDDLGVADGQSRGLRIAPATTNKMTAPTGYYTARWTAQSSVVRTDNTDRRFVLPGQSSSYKLTARAGTNNLHYESVNVGNTNTHSFYAIVAKDDLSAVTSADCQIYYGASLTTTFTSLGSGLYLAEATAAGVNASYFVGLLIQNGRTVYQLFFSTEETSLRTPLCYGTLLGCAFSGTAWASTSTRTAGRVRIPVEASTFGLGSGTIALTWKTDFANTAANDRFFFSYGSTSIRAYYQASNDQIYFTDGTNSINTSAQTFAAGDVLRLIFIWGASGLAIYKNGASVASGATYSPPVMPSYCYIGTTDSATSHLGGIISGFTIYDVAPTAAQISAIDAYSLAAASADKRADYIPYFWTVDGDDVVDNANDSTRDNWGVAGGIPGSAKADTILDVSLPAAVDVLRKSWIFSDYQLWFVNPSTYDYAPYTGTPTVDANAEGGYHQSQDGNANWYGAYAGYLVPERFVVMGRLRNTTGSLVSTLYPDAIPIDASTTNFGLHYLGEFALLSNDDILDGAVADYYQGNGYKNVSLDNGTTTAGSLLIDYIKAFPSPGLCIQATTGAGIGRVLIRGDYAMYSPSTINFQLPDTHEVIGDAIELQPGGLTNIVMAIGYKDASTITQTTTIVVRVAPRWRLL